MDNIDNQEQNHESNNAGNEKDEPQERINSKPYFTPKQNQSGRLHSRSRSPISTRSPKQWRSSNPFINFLQEFRQNFTGVRSTRIFRLAGERWRQMSPEEKQPFARVAAGMRSRKVNQQRSEKVNQQRSEKVNQQRNEEVNKTNKNTERTKNERPKAKQTRRIKKPERNSKKRKQVKKKKNVSESDTDSVTSGTAGSRTSGDISDESS